MVEETTVNPNVPMEWAPVWDQAPMEWAPVEGDVNQEEQIIAQIIQLIAGLSAESQRQLMGFLGEQFSSVVSQEEQAHTASPEEQNRKAEVMSEAF